MQEDLAAEPEVFERQIHILEWFYRRFRENLPENRILKYEELIESQGRNLGAFFPDAAQLNENLVSKNVNKFYDKALMQDLGDKLLKRSGVIWDFYDKSDVENLLAEVNASSATGTP